MVVECWRGSEQGRDQVWFELCSVLAVAANRKDLLTKEDTKCYQTSDLADADGSHSARGGLLEDIRDSSKIFEAFDGARKSVDS